MRSLPPLGAVRAFEAAARHGNFTRAGVELGMTQAAVSYQVKLLEERLGGPLFHRSPRGVQLSEMGERLAPALTAALDSIAEAFDAVRSHAAEVLTISALHSFASLWLAPRLGGFQLTHPDVAVRLDTSARLVDLAREPFDVALRAGTGGWPGLVQHALMRVHYTPLAAPSLLERYGGVRAAADLLRLPRLTPDDSWWADWLERAGVPMPATRTTGLSLDSQQMEGAAALAGQGVAIMMPALWRHEMEAGRLVQPFELIAFPGSRIWLVHPESGRGKRKVRVFRDWLLAEVERAAADDPFGAYR